MLGSFVCRQCRTRLSRRIVPVRTPQWQPRATFLSLRNTKTAQDDADTAPSEEQPTAPSQQADPSYVAPSPPRIRFTPVGDREPEPTPGRYSKHVLDDTKGWTQYDDPEASTQTDGYPAGTEESNVLTSSYAQYLKESLDNGQVQTAWNAFERFYTSKDCIALTNPAPEDLPLLEDGKIFTRLLNYTVSSFCRGHAKLFVTPTTVLFRYEQLGIARREHWTTYTLAYLTNSAMRAANLETNTPQRDLASLLSELLSVWRLFFQCKGPKSDPLHSISTEWHLPTIDTLPERFHHRDIGERLREFHPKLVENIYLGFCATYLYSISDALNSIESLQQQCTTLLQFLERLLAGSSVAGVLQFTDMNKGFKTLPTEVQQQIKHEIRAVPSKAIAMIGSTVGSSGTTILNGGALHNEDSTRDDIVNTLTDKANTPADAAANMEEFYLKRVARAVESRTSLLKLESLWNQVEMAYTTKDQGVAIPSRIYNAFLSGFMTLHNSRRSVDIWNHMIANGVQPDQQSWVALLDGCTQAKDLSGLNTIWTRMINAGIEPDQYAWNTRVHGLIALRNINLGLATLDDMGKRWLSAENVINSPQTHGKSRKGPRALPQSAKIVNKCTKPTVEVVNGAITALVKIRADSLRHEKRIEYVRKILGWASNFAIQPDARTYNSLFQLYIRANDQGTAFKILRQMEVANVEADMATHTMLLGAAFDNAKFDNLSQAKQTERILSLFKDLESDGLKLNAYVYSSAISRLLKQYNNFSAVRTIIDHMQSRNLSPGAPVYTSLVSHYFQQTPPDIPAVDSLVNQLFTDDRMPSNNILSDRIVEGYATHGEVGMMMSVLTRTVKQGQLPGYASLTAVVKALVEDGDFERARAIVRDVQRGEGVAQRGIMGDVHSRRRFHASVRDFNLGLEEERMGESWRIRAAGEGSADDSDQHHARLDGVREGEFDGRGGASQHEEYAHEQYGQIPPSMEHPVEDSDVGFGTDAERLADEEDVHGFLTDEPEPEPNYAHRP